MPLGTSRRTLTAVATGFALTCLALGGAPAFAAQVRSQEWWLQALHVTRAWHTARGARVVVAVLDTGVDPAQADLSGSVTSGPDYTGSGRVSGGAYWGIHGTEMASLIAGHGHGARGASGITGAAPAARILSVRVSLESDDPLLADPAVAGRLPGAIARGIRYAVKHGAKVIDLPLDPVTTPGAAGAGGSKAEQAAVAFALARGVVLVAPAGDGGARADAVNYPAAYHGVISVGAFDSRFIKAPFSSRRSYVTLTAAGEGMAAAIPPAGYTTVNSTSAASAVVAGIVALIRSRFPGLTPAKVRKALTDSTVYRPPGGKADGSGYGTVDAARALAAAASMVQVAPTPSVSAGSASAASGAPPAQPAGHGGTRATLLTDVGIAVAALLALALVILAVGRMQRRRARAVRLAGVRAAVEVRARQPRQALTPSAGPDGYLPAPPAAGLSGIARPGRGAAGPGTGRAGTFAGGESPGGGRPAASPSGRAVLGRAFPAHAFRGGVEGGDSSGADGPGAEGGAGAGAAGAGTGHTSGISRPGTVRRPKVSGGPPWGPAPRPEGELPWARETTVPPERAEALPRRRPQPEWRSVWDTIAEEAWPGGPRRDTPGSRSTPAGDPGAGQGAGDSAQPARGWLSDAGGASAARRAQTGTSHGPRPGPGDPVKATEAFPTVPSAPAPGAPGESAGPFPADQAGSGSSGSGPADDDKNGDTGRAG